MKVAIGAAPAEQENAMKHITASDLANLSIYEIGQIYRDTLKVYLNAAANGPDRSAAFRTLQAISEATARVA